MKIRILYQNGDLYGCFCLYDYAYPDDRVSLDDYVFIDGCVFIGDCACPYCYVGSRCCACFCETAIYGYELGLNFVKYFA